LFGVAPQGHDCLRRGRRLAPRDNTSPLGRSPRKTNGAGTGHAALQARSGAPLKTGPPASIGSIGGGRAPLRLTSFVSAMRTPPRGHS
jgi:hypothetical protein